MTKPTNILLAFDWYDRRVYRGIVQFAREHDWHISPYFFSDRAIPRGWQGDGAITCYGQTLGKFILSLDMPRVDVSVIETPVPIPRVITDNEAVGVLAAEHFLERGFRHFAYYDWPDVHVNQIRKRTFFDAIQDADIPTSQCHVIRQVPGRMLHDWEAHQESLLGQLAEIPRPLAVFTGQDNLGATLIETCVNNGIHVPEEIAVLGVDDIEFLCDCLAVPLSSIDTQLEKLGHAAAQQLHRLMEGDVSPDAPPVLIPPGDVVCRQSTDILAVPHPAVVRARQFIKTAFGNPLTLEDIAASAGMSKRGLEKAFRRHLGRTPAVELRRIRVDNAKRMLTETDEKIDTIARGCGYSNSSNLSFALNRETGMSPRAYRKEFRG